LERFLIFKKYVEKLKQAALRQSRHFVPLANAKAFAFVLIQRKPPTRVSLFFSRETAEKFTFPAFCERLGISHTAVCDQRLLAFGNSVAF